MKQGLISKGTAKEHNLPRMTREDFRRWLQVNETIAAFERAGMPVPEVERNDRFDIVCRYADKRVVR